MNQSENINELASALSKVQGKMKAAEKNNINPFHKNKYADLSSVWDTIRVVMSENGLCLLQYGDVLEGRGLTLVTMLCHSSGQWIKSFLPLKPSKDDSQGIGAAMTYMRRYALCALLGVVADEDLDDDGETACGRGKNQKTNNTKINTNNIEEKIDIPKNDQLLSQGQLATILSAYANTDDEFKKNFRNHMIKEWHAHEFWQIKEVSFNTAMEGINRNIEKNTIKVNS